MESDYPPTTIGDLIKLLQCYDGDERVVFQFYTEDQIGSYYEQAPSAISDTVVKALQNSIEVSCEDGVFYDSIENIEKDWAHV